MIIFLNLRNREVYSHVDEKKLNNTRKNDQKPPDIYTVRLNARKKFLQISEIQKLCHIYVQDI